MRLSPEDRGFQILNLSLDVYRMTPDVLESLRVNSIHEVYGHHSHFLTLQNQQEIKTSPVDLEAGTKSSPSQGWCPTCHSAALDSISHLGISRDCGLLKSETLSSYLRLSLAPRTVPGTQRELLNQIQEKSEMSCTGGITVRAPKTTCQPAWYPRRLHGP